MTENLPYRIPKFSFRSPVSPLKNGPGRRVNDILIPKVWSNKILNLYYLLINIDIL